MTTLVMPKNTGRSAARSSEPSIHEIISAAREKPVRAASRGAWGLSLLTAALLWAAFAPVDCGPLGWLALTPVLLLVRTPVRARWLYTAVYCGGLAQALASLQWMRWGDPSM